MLLHCRCSTWKDFEMFSDAITRTAPIKNINRCSSLNSIGTIQISAVREMPPHTFLTLTFSQSFVRNTYKDINQTTNPCHFFYE